MLAGVREGPSALEMSMRSPSRVGEYKQAIVLFARLTTHNS